MKLLNEGIAGNGAGDGHSISSPRLGVTGGGGGGGGASVAAAAGGGVVGVASQMSIHRLARDDFVLVSEFSEHEGPVPLVAFPDSVLLEDTGFDVSKFVIRIMSVDNQVRVEYVPLFLAFSGSLSPPPISLSLSLSLSLS